jgi:hypothetical protein
LLTFNSFPFAKSLRLWRSESVFLLLCIFIIHTHGGHISILPEFALKNKYYRKCCYLNVPSSATLVNVVET